MSSVLIDATPEYTVTFTPVDALSTDPDEMAYQIRTASGGGGTLLDSGACTNGVEFTTPTITDLFLVEGPNTRYLRTRDGANNWTDTTFIVLAEQVPPTPGEIDDALAGGTGAVAIFFSYEQRRADFSFVADITPAVRRASVQCVNNRAIVRSARFDIDKLTLPDSFDPDVSLIAINGVLQTARGPQLFTWGLFRLDMSDEDLEPGSVFWPNVPGSDLASILHQSFFEESFSVTTSDNVVETIREIIAGESWETITLRHDIPDDATLFPVEIQFDTKLSKLEIINYMALEVLFWKPIWPDERGVFRTRAIVEPADEEVAQVYTTVNEPRMIGLPFRRRRVKQGLANVYKVLIDDPRRTPEYAHIENADVLSRVSTANQPLSVVEDSWPVIRDIALAGTVASVRLLEDAGMAEQADLITSLDPRRGPHETYQLYIHDDLRDEEIEAGTLWRVLSWQAELDVNGNMLHKLARANDYNLTTVV